MKKTMVLCALLIGLGASAQHRPQHPGHDGEHSNGFTTEQQATIQAKRLTLALSLDQQQQDQIAAAIKARLDSRMELRSRGKSEEHSGKHKDGASRYSALNDRLDREIAFQKTIKGILSDSQFEQWRSLREKQVKARKNRSRDGHKRHQGQG